MSAPQSTTRNAPAWFRYAVIAVAALIMCSCRVADSQLRIVEDPKSEAPTSDQAANDQTVEDAALDVPDLQLSLPASTITLKSDSDRYQSSTHTPQDLAAAARSAPLPTPLLADRGAFFNRGRAQAGPIDLVDFEAPLPPAEEARTPEAEAHESDSHQLAPPTSEHALPELDVEPSKQLLPAQDASSGKKSDPVGVADAQVMPATCPPQGCAPFDGVVGPPGCCDGGLCCNECPAMGPGDEYLCDGGDFGLPAAVINTGQVTGLEQEDTVAHYETVDGRTIITPSKKVCIYSPRFAAVRQVIDVRAYARYDMPEGAIQDQAPVKVAEHQDPSTTLAALEAAINRKKDPPSLLKERQQLGELGRDERAAAVIGSLAPYANLAIVRTGELVGEERAKIARASLAAITWTGVEAPQVLIDAKQAHAEVSVKSPGTIYLLIEPNNPKLRLCKLANKGTAQLGEEVEFTLRFDNVGDRVIGNVTIVDHLTTRLEYVEGSQKSTLKANFSTQDDDNDSLTLRWEIQEPLQPGDGGILQFRTKVR